MDMIFEIKSIKRITFSILVVVISSLLIPACTEQGMSDLEKYVREIKAQKKGTIPPLPEFKQYKMFTYQAQDIRDPFIPVVDVEVVTKRGYSGPRPDDSRIKEPLESFSLDTLRMMGSMEQGEHHWVLIQDPDGLLHRLTVGNYLGLNNGKIISLSDERIEIMELVPDGNGWKQRAAGIALSEEE